jgi:hypothetical protein
MLFHITMTHTEDNCAIYRREMMPGVFEAFENLEALGKELNVKLHYFTWCGPDHVAFVLLEADTLAAVSRYVFSIPMPQKVNIVPVICTTPSLWPEQRRHQRTTERQGASGRNQDYHFVVRHLQIEVPFNAQGQEPARQLTQALHL